jgi:AcrR family transcriptional regulator
VREPVKGVSPAGRRREERARATRDRISDAAVRLFLQHGYVGTTVTAIAREAGVAPATVYQAFGTKYAVLARALDAAIAGDAEPVEVLNRDWVRQARHEPDPRRRLALVVRRTSEVAARTAPLKRVMRDAAATDPEVRDLIDEDARRRHDTHEALVDLVIEAGPLRSGLRRSDAVATYFALVNSDTYELLVGQLGWSVDHWQRWLADLLGRELLGEPGA